MNRKQALLNIFKILESNLRSASNLENEEISEVFPTALN